MTDGHQLAVEAHPADPNVELPLLPLPATVRRPRQMPVLVPAQLFHVRDHVVHFSGYATCQLMFNGHRPWQHVITAYEDRFMLTRGSVTVTVGNYKMPRDMAIGLTSGIDTPSEIFATADSTASSFYRFRVHEASLNLTAPLIIAKHMRVDHVAAVAAHALGLRATRTKLQLIETGEVMTPGKRLRECGVRERHDGVEVLAIET